MWVRNIKEFCVILTSVIWCFFVFFSHKEMTKVASRVFYLYVLTTLICFVLKMEERETLMGKHIFPCMIICRNVLSVQTGSLSAFRSDIATFRCEMCGHLFFSNDI